MIIFIDDILIYSRNRDEHEEYLRIALETLKKHQLYAKFSKCEFWLNRVHFLKYVVSKERVSIDPSKIEVVSNCKAPKSIIEVQSLPDRERNMNGPRNEVHEDLSYEEKLVQILD